MNVHLHGAKYAKKLAERQSRTRKMLSHALQIADHIIALDGRVTFEWPANAGLWELPEVVEFIARYGLHKVQCHCCGFGLRGKEEYLKKPCVLACKRP